MAQNPVDEQADAISLPDVLPVLPLKDAVIFPYIILPLSISRDPSMLAVEDALNGDRIILLAPQRDGSIEEITRAGWRTSRPAISTCGRTKPSSCWRRPRPSSGYGKWATC